MVDANVSAAGDSPKKSPLSSINEEHQLSLLFFIVMSAWRMFVCFIWFSFLAGSFVHIFVRRSLETPHTTHSSRNSSEKIVFKLVNLFNKMSGQTRWSQISKKKIFFSALRRLLDTSAVGLREISAPRVHNPYNSACEICVRWWGRWKMISC